MNARRQPAAPAIKTKLPKSGTTIFTSMSARADRIRRTRRGLLGATGATGALAAMRGLVAIVASASLITAGCAYLPPPGLKSPKLSVSNLAVRGIDSESVRFLLSVEADNPNAVDMPVSDLRFDLDLLGRRFASGAATEATLTLPANATRTIPIEFTVSTDRLFEFLRGLRTSDWGKLSYRLDGSARWGDGFFSIPFERRGELDLRSRVRDLLRLMPKF